MPVGSQEHLASGLSSLRKAATLNIASQLVGFAALAFALVALISLVAALVAAPARPARLVEELLRPGVLAPLAVVLVLLLASAVLGLLATFAFLVPGVGRLAKWSGAFETPAKLVKWGYWSALILGALALLAGAAGFAPIIQAVMERARPLEPRSFALQVVAGLLAALALAVLAGIANLIGFAGLVMALFELSSQTKVDGFKVAAILLILGFALNFAALLPYAYLASMLAGALTLVGWIFARDAAGKALAAAAAPPPPPPSSVTA
jgi:hypothetical protein